MSEMKKLIESMDMLETGANDIGELTTKLAMLASALSEAIDIAKQLDRVVRRNPDIVTGPFSGQLNSYLIPHLEAWLEDANQPGSVAALNKMVYDDAEEDDDYTDWSMRQGEMGRY